MKRKEADYENTIRNGRMKLSQCLKLAGKKFAMVFIASGCDSCETTFCEYHLIDLDQTKVAC